MKLFSHICLFLIICFGRKWHVLGNTAIPVPDLQWTARNANGSISINATVPGGIYTDLMTSGVLNNGDFYYRYNDLEYRWVAYEEWIYTVDLDLPDSILDNERVVFEFHGLDTAVEIFLDDIKIAESYSMFSRLIIDVKDYLTTPITQTLQLTFRSPVEYSSTEYDLYIANHGYEVLPECVDSTYNGECHANIIRKMQASFSWDFAPAFPSIGIWKKWHIFGWSSLKINSIYFESVPITPLPETANFELLAAWTVYFKVHYDLASSTNIVNGTLIVSLDGTEYVNTAITIDPSDLDGLNGIYESYFIVPENTVETWWPNGYGTQSLYNLTVSFVPDILPDTDSSSETVRVGFRTVELDESFVDSHDPTLGRHYRAKINNVYIFLKGSNWVPAHALPEQVTPEYRRMLLTAARDTHQNCIRVWGGGIYERGNFYDIADELGILIWEDLMFACSMYPADEPFLNRVENEMRFEIRRLQNHPSILLWATNNENEAALIENWYGTNQNFDQYKADYVALYVDTIATVVKEEDPSRRVVISSPSNGIVSEEVGYISDNPGDYHYGDVHYYNTMMNGWTYSGYPTPRFASEYGFQSFPSYQTLLSVFDEDDLQIDSPMMEHRQHHPNGQQELENQIKMHFAYDKDATSFQQYLYLGQVHQAMSIKTETEFYRRMRSTMTADGSGLTMGALYWQLDDTWQGASWSSIEYGGRWKVLHYFSRFFFSQLIAVPWIEDGRLKVTVVNDYPSDVAFDKLMLSLERIAQDLPSIPISYESDFYIPTQSAVVVLDVDLEADLNVTENCPASEITGEPYDNCFFTVDVLDSLDNLIAPQNFLLLGEPKNADLPEVTITVDTNQSSDDVVDVIVTADGVALFVFLESPYPGVFSDNGFILPYEIEKILTFTGRQPVDVDDFLSTLYVYHVSNDTTE